MSSASKTNQEHPNASFSISHQQFPGVTNYTSGLNAATFQDTPSSKNQIPGQNFYDNQSGDGNCLRKKSLEEFMGYTNENNSEKMYNVSESENNSV